MAATQKNREIQIFTPLGEDALLFYRMNGRESVSEPFEFELELLSDNPAINPEKLLGENVATGIVLPDGSWRYFNGYVTRFGHYGNLDEYAYYRATVRPWLWFLTRTSNCRIFQNKTTPDIIKQVFRDQGFSDFKEKLSGSYSPREYCVQYRETDFNFVCRLMEEEGIHYYFTHEKGKHFLVMADSGSAHGKFPGYEKIPFHSEHGSTDRSRADHIHDWGFAREVQTGAYELTDYDFKKPKADLLVKSKIKQSHAHAENEFFDYPGRYTETGVGDGFVRHRIEEHHARFERCEGRCNARGLAVGHLFNLEEFSRKDQNREYWVLAAAYRLRLDAYFSQSTSFGGEKIFECSFTAVDSKQPYRPPRVIPKPLVHGAQTAIVVGPSGDEIYTDKYGRVKVHFHWDRKERWESGKKEEDSSCWIRVSHPWAGKGWGAISIPRIGQEVIVDFLEGDPDQPIITGRVYNADAMPPFGLPGSAVISGIKSNTHKGKGYNEMTMDDTAGKEKITIHAQYDKNTTVLHDKTTTVNGKFTETIDKDTAITIKTGKLEHKVNTGTADYYVKGAMSEKFDSTWSSTTKNNITIKSTEGEILIQAANKITLLTGDSKITMDKGGNISVTGKKITIIGDDEVKASSKKTEITGSVDAKLGTGSQNICTNTSKTAISGAAINSSAVGMHEISGALVKIN